MSEKWDATYPKEIKLKRNAMQRIQKNATNPKIAHQIAAQHNEPKHDRTAMPAITNSNLIRQLKQLDQQWLPAKQKRSSVH